MHPTLTTERSLDDINGHVRSRWPAALRDIIVVDTETTGFGRTARLVEIAAVHAQNGVVVRSFERLVNPGMPIPPGATRVHGITDAGVRSAPSAAKVLREFRAFCEGLPLVAHNASFDRGVLAAEFERTWQATPGLAVYCTLRIARHAMPDADNHRLPTLAGLLGLSVHHRALGDARAALAVLIECVVRLGPRALAAYRPVGTL